MTRSPAIVSVLVAALVLAACSRKPADTTPARPRRADLIITGGPIVTMEGDQPTTAEAIVVDDGRIIFVGSKADALKQQADGTVLKDLAGKTLMPGFIDGHAHAQQFGTQAVGANLLAPPDGDGQHHRRCRRQAEGLRRRPRCRADRLDLRHRL